MGELYDKRSIEPIEDFKKMISENNLSLQNIETYTIYENEDTPIEMAMLEIALDNES